MNLPGRIARWRRAPGVKRVDPNIVAPHSGQWMHHLSISLLTGTPACLRLQAMTKLSTAVQGSTRPSVIGLFGDVSIGVIHITHKPNLQMFFVFISSNATRIISAWLQWEYHHRHAAINRQLLIHAGTATSMKQSAGDRQSRSSG